MLLLSCYIYVSMWFFFLGGGWRFRHHAHGKQGARRNGIPQINRVVRGRGCSGIVFVRFFFSFFWVFKSDPFFFSFFTQISTEKVYRFFNYSKNIHPSFFFPVENARVGKKKPKKRRNRTSTHKYTSRYFFFKRFKLKPRESELEL